MTAALAFSSSGASIAPHSKNQVNSLSRPPTIRRPPRPITAVNCFCVPTLFYVSGGAHICSQNFRRTNLCSSHWKCQFELLFAASLPEEMLRWVLRRGYCIESLSLLLLAAMLLCCPLHAVRSHGRIPHAACRMPHKTVVSALLRSTKLRSGWERLTGAIWWRSTKSEWVLFSVLTSREVHACLYTCTKFSIYWNAKSVQKNQYIFKKHQI
jgi:hypothetical protein